MSWLQSTELAENLIQQNEEESCSQLVRLTYPGHHVKQERFCWQGMGQPARLSKLVLLLAATYLCMIKVTVFTRLTYTDLSSALRHVSEICTKPNAGWESMLVYVVTLLLPSTSEATVTWGLLLQLTDCPQIVSALLASEGLARLQNGFKHTKLWLVWLCCKVVVLCCRNIHVSHLGF